MNEIKNPETERFAQDLAEAIRNDDAATYESLMKSDRNPIDKMVFWEVLAFRDRVHYLAKHGGKQ